MTKNKVDKEINPAKKSGRATAVWGVVLAMTVILLAMEFVGVPMPWWTFLMPFTIVAGGALAVPLFAIIAIAVVLGLGILGLVALGAIAVVLFVIWLVPFIAISSLFGDLEDNIDALFGKEKKSSKKESDVIDNEYE